MKKILISLMVIFLLSACTPDQPDQSINWNNLTLTKSSTCATFPVPPPDDCPDNDPITALIQVDADGAPTGVAPIESCGGKQVTWKYENDVANALPFFIVFDPAQFPGNSTYEPISKPKPNPQNVMNQELRINTRAKKGAPTDPSECMNYLIIVPDKGILDPVFIIKR